MPNCDQWPDVEHIQNRHLCDNIHRHITISYPLNLIMDTKEFQRLRELKQSGVACMVFPSAYHTRFSHSIGTCYLADTFMRHLRQYAELDISPVDHLCVCVAALCHDLGHGPFSHMYDNEFRPAVKAEEWSHEDGSIALLRRIFEKPAVKRAFEAYFGTGQTFADNLLFIQELIHSKRVDDKNNWIAKGRGSNKSFLYDIVSNNNDGIDVDKWDYLLRDSKTCGVSIAFNKDTVDRLITNARVLEYEGFKRICYADKVLSSIQNIFQARQAMHENVYQHKTVKAIESLVVQALILANDHLMFYADDGKAYKLSEVHQDMSAYLRATDYVTELIRNSSDPGLAKSREILDNISERRLPKCISSEQFTYDKAKQCLLRLAGNVSRITTRDVQVLVERTLRERLGPDYEKAEVMLLVKQSDRGSGSRNPLERVVVYGQKTSGESGLCPRKMDEEWIRVNSTSEAMINTLLLYIDRNTEPDLKDRVLCIYDDVLKYCGLKSSCRSSSEASDSSESSGIHSP